MPTAELWVQVLSATLVRWVPQGETATPAEAWLLLTVTDPDVVELRVLRMWVVCTRQSGGAPNLGQARP